MKIRFLGGAGEVGRSAILVNDELLMDYGIKPTDPPTYPQGNGVRPKTIIISHGHLDHCGVIPNLATPDLAPEIYATASTAKLTDLLARDTLNIAEHSSNHSTPFDFSDIKAFQRIARYVNYNEEFKTNDYSFSLFDAGHIPGSSMIHLEKDGQSLFYTGDINSNPTELQNGAQTDLPEADSLIIESTYFGKDHPSRKLVEEQFIESLRETLDNGGRAIVPAFGISRTQEIVLVLKKYGLHAYVDGMGNDVYKLMRKSPDFLRNPEKLDMAFSSMDIVKPEDREEIIQNPSIIVTTAGMLNGGPVLYYIPQIYDDPNSKILLTGYQAENTNGRRALENGYIILEDYGHPQTVKLACGVENFNFSAHSGDAQLKEIVKKFCDNGTENVFPVHGDNTKGFADWINEELGVEACAPVNGETFYLN